MKNRNNIRRKIPSGVATMLIIISIIIGVTIISATVILKFMPDSIGAYYIQDFIELCRVAF